MSCVCVCVCARAPVRAERVCRLVYINACQYVYRYIIQLCHRYVTIWRRQSGWRPENTPLSEPGEPLLSASWARGPKNRRVGTRENPLQCAWQAAAVLAPLSEPGEPLLSPSWARGPKNRRVGTRENPLQ